MSKSLTRAQYEALEAVSHSGYGTKDGFAIEQIQAETALAQSGLRRTLRHMVTVGLLVRQQEGNRHFFTLGPKGEEWSLYVLTDEARRLFLEYDQKLAYQTDRQPVSDDKWQF